MIKNIQNLYLDANCKPGKSTKSIWWYVKHIFKTLFFVAVFAGNVYANTVNLPMVYISGIEINISTIIQIESSGNPNAYNPRSGCIGLMQISPKGALADWNKYPGSRKGPPGSNR